MLREIEIRSKKALDIYMNPQRQRLLKCMDVYGAPMTPKQLSTRLGISPSAVTFHMKKLLELGLVELDHTRMINGICAKYYRRVPSRVLLHAGVDDGLRPEKEALLDYMMSELWDGFRRYLSELGRGAPPGGDAKNGVLYLDEAGAGELWDFFVGFIERNSSPRPGASAWEFALVAYPCGGASRESPPGAIDTRRDGE